MAACSCYFRFLLETASQLRRNRGLLSALVGREIKARYRGSVLGFLWSLVNPALLLGVYSIVFGWILPARGADPYALFLVTGLFPWIWLSSSLLEGSTAFQAHGALLRKAAFPAAVLPMVPVFANLAHFLLALPVVAGAFVVGRALGYDLGSWPALLLPVVILLQIPFVAGLALGLGALNVHFKDVRDILTNSLTLLFFLTPVLYPLDVIPHPALWWVVRLNPFTPFTLAYQQILFFEVVPDPALWLQMILVGALAWMTGTAIFERLEDTLVEAVDAVIRAERVSKRYRRLAPGGRLRTLKSALLQRSLTRGLTAEEAIQALDDVSFEVGKGEAFGLIGGNGSGKSTLLKIVAGILKPSSGSLTVDGRVGALIELGAGFHPEISGRENVFINGALLGLGRREIERRFDEIVAFSGLENFIEEPVKTYSSGMYVRLGFAVAVHTDPDVLVVDEVLAVGDEEFSHRCLRRIEEMLAADKTLLFVSHSLDLVEHLCDRALWLDGGKARIEGEPRRVIDAYRQAVAEAEGQQHQAENIAETVADANADPLRWGSGAATVEAVRLRAADGEERYNVRCGEAVTFEIEVRAAAGTVLEDFVVGVALATPRGVEVWGTNTELAGFKPRRLTGAATARLVCPALRLGPGDYTLDAAVHSRDGAPYDYRRRLIGFRVDEAEGEPRGVGLYQPRHEWRFEGDIAFEG